MPVEHYENFPVASFLLPSHLRPAVEAIYAFARGADDAADEGDASPPERLAALATYEAGLDGIARGSPPGSTLFTRLASVVTLHRLPLTPLFDLLSAFRQDVVTTRYGSFTELLDYCRRSANPVGALMLHLYETPTPENLRDSDAICSALQLINFWQDVDVDFRKGRIYLPQEDLARFGVTEAHLAAGRCDADWVALMRFETARARAMMLDGAPLALRLPGRIGWELRMVVQGGLRILESIEKNGFDVFRRRPRLGPADWAVMAWRAIGMRASLPRQRRVS